MNFTEFHFIRPYWFLAIIPAIVLLIFLLKSKLNQGNWSKVCDAELLPFVLQDRIANQSRFGLFLGMFSSLMVIFVLAGPTWERIPSPVFRNQAALVIALDLSTSMDASDIKPSRLIRARYKINDILKQRNDGETALLVYAGDAFTVTPLTGDNETIASQLSALTTEIMPSQGSNTVMALEKAVELLKQSGQRTGEILLITDGVDLNKTNNMVQSLSDYSLSILGVGTTEGAPIKLVQGGFVKDRQGNIVVSKLNNSELSRLAVLGNGIYQEISSDNNDIDALLSRLDKSVETENSLDNNLLIDQWHEKGPWLLLIVLPLVALQFRKGILSLAFICLLPFPESSFALEWTDLWQTKNQQAEQAFRQENYQQAAEQFNNSQWKAAAQYKAGQFEQAIESLQNDQTATGFYNKGNALAKSGKLKEAIDAYDRALQINPDNEDATYNKEQVKKQLKEQQQKQQGDQQQQSDQDDSQQSDQENKDQQDSSENSENQKNKNQKNPEQQNKEQKADTDQSEPQQQAEENAESDKPKEAQAQQKAEQDKKAEETESQQASDALKYDESVQANEQWLKRIPDDPGGLLKRKFKYQYGQRGRKANNNQAW